ncbi:hypothetical protein RB623_28290 [Mesorhizobium sp. LHD-90]|uniref:hypothetical protein n=1 Tax=Mesorhizobium sp. LHD-90 TaxID=3071414 RepID=UPI0027E0BEBB|nr:hypothetical protein [Mesorhizobium sp. LHD-90]MDQ6437971.1 hypothetical protein [Mesorhizobium sp. LHD-90]
MKTVFRFSVALLGVAMIAGCTLTEGQFNNMQATIGGSPAAKRQAISECVVRQKARPISEKKNDSVMFNIGLSNFPTTYCTRLWNATAAGRITYADYIKLTQPTADSSKVIRIMQGR